MISTHIPYKEFMTEVLNETHVINIYQRIQYNFSYNDFTTM